MNTPIFNFAKSYAESDTSRLHMPGHKGKTFLGCEKYDITEIDGADVLYHADGIIKESEHNASALFNSAATFYSTEGSTLCIKAMLSLVCSDKEGRPLILAARNVHKAFIYAGALLDFDVEWMYSEESKHLCSCIITAEEIEKHILNCPRKPDAVYITSPDYLGNIADIKGISDVCDRHGIPLLVDNAHGAYLGFLEKSIHPINLGATMCCDSAHKTLPVLTGGAYLHISDKGRSFIPYAEDSLSLFASTSPSYLILESLDICNEYLSNGYREKLKKVISVSEKLRSSLEAYGFEVKATEPLKLTVSALNLGYTGSDLGRYLYENKISCEFCDNDFAVMMFTPENDEEDFIRIRDSLKKLPVKERIPGFAADPLVKSSQKLTLRQAVLAKSQWLETEKATGKICASPTVSCPPAVPVIVSGEEITASAVKILKAYGTEKIKVVV